MLPFLAVTLLLLPAAEAAGESHPCCGPREMKLRALLQGEQQPLALASTTMVGRWRREEIELSLVQPTSTAISVLAALAAPVDQATVWEWNDDGTELGITVGQSQVDACTKSEGATVTMSANAFSDCIRRQVNQAVQNEKRQREEHMIGYDATGGKIWLASVLLARFLARDGRSWASGRRCIELGTGTGIVSITAAQLGAHVQATDGNPVTVALADANAERNLNSKKLARFNASTYNWGDRFHAKFQTIFLSDVLYSTYKVRPILRSVDAVCETSACDVLLVYTERRPSQMQATSGWKADRVDLEAITGPLGEFIAGMKATGFTLHHVPLPVGLREDVEAEFGSGGVQHPLIEGGGDLSRTILVRASKKRSRRRVTLLHKTRRQQPND